MSVNVRLDHTFSVLLSGVVLAITLALGAAIGFFVGIFGVLGMWGLGFAAGKELIVIATLIGTLLTLFAGVKYCKAMYWCDTKPR
ncbi:MAG: hypothetical protein ABIH23_28915 [bacterium]